MRILPEESGSWRKHQRSKSGRRVTFLLVLSFITVLIFIAILLVRGFGPDRDYQKLQASLRRAFRAGTDQISKMIEPRAISEEIPHLDISMKKSAYRNILQKREEAIGGPIFITDSSDYVRAFAKVGDEISEVRIRLKGDWISQLKTGKKWSFRIETKGDNCILGMKRFSIHHPKARNYIGEWLFHRALHKAGIIALRYEFINVTLNNQNLGIYAMEEHFEKRLLEHNRRREGPIIRFNEDLFWKDALLFHKASRESKGTGSRSFWASSIDAFNTSRILGDPALLEQFKTGSNLLESLRFGQLKTSEVFDVDLLANYLALMDLFGGKHASSWINFRFYYNPVTSLLEPVGFDANAGQRIADQRIAGLISESKVLDLDEATFHDHFKEILFSDPLFFKVYIATLESVSKVSWLDELFNEVNDEMEKNIDILQSEFIDWRFSKDVYYDNAEYIRMILGSTIKGVHAYLCENTEESPEKMVVRVGNLQKLPIEVLGLKSKKGEVFHPFGEENPVLQPRLTHVDYVPIVFSTSESAMHSDYLSNDFYLEYRIIGTDPLKKQRIEVYPWSFQEEDFTRKYLSEKEQNVGSFDFLVADEDEILIKPGTWTLDRTLVIPAGFTVRSGGGTEIRLTNHASIISFSPLVWIGSEEAPIIISSDSTGEGLLFLNTEGTMTLNNVIFRNLSAPMRAGSQLTGAVTFYESNVEMYNCQFREARCEDALNIIRSSFRLEHCLVWDAFSDGIDVDFGDGSINECSFSRTGNDGIDISGSNVAISECVVDNAGDKGLSIGEDSDVTASGIVVTNSYLGVGSKDASSVTIDTLTISDCQYGLAAYQKKPEFGPATIMLHNYAIQNTLQEILVDKGSSITVEDETTIGKVKDAFRILYPQ